MVVLRAWVGRAAIAEPGWRLAPRRCVVLSQAPLGQASSSAWAQGGLAAALAPGDNPKLHAEDTVAAGAGLVDPAVASLIAREGPDRVRDLIGDAHWLSDGHHKERLLAGTMARHLPRRFAVTTGFLLDRHATSSCSREQDILVLDLWRHPLLFGTAELSITYSISAVASVSVKSQFKKDAFEDSWNTLASIPSPPEPLRRIAFFFDSDAPTRIVDWLLPLVKTGAPGADYIATTGDFFARIDRGDGFAKLRGFSTAGASFGTALASLVSDLSDGHETASEDLVFDIERLPATLLFDEDVRFDTH